MKHIVTILLSSLLFISCQNDAPKEEAKSTETEHHHHDDEIVLNNGEKWKVDDDMMTIIKHMQEDATGFEGEVLEDYATLAKHLKENIDELTSNCTMEGQAHDELHKWLLPYIELVDDFAKSETAENAKEQHSKIVASFETFDQYFQ